jgi:hypothetical protein
MAAVPRGALIGAASGALLGSGTGVLISDDKLLGSTKASKLAFGAREAVPAGLLVGTVFGAIIGPMIGHQNDHGPSEQRGQPASAANDAQRQRPKGF